MHLSSDYSWPLCWQKQAGNGTEKTCIVSHINQLQSRSTCVARMNSRGREKVLLLCLLRYHFPFSVCQVIALYCLIQEMPSYALLSFHKELVLLNSSTVQEEHSMQFYTLHQSEKQKDQKSIKKSEVL